MRQFFILALLIPAGLCSTNLFNIERRQSAEAPAASKLIAGRGRIQCARDCAQAPDCFGFSWLEGLCRLFSWSAFVSQPWQSSGLCDVYDCCAERLNNFSLLLDGVECNQVNLAVPFSVANFTCNAFGSRIRVKCGDSAGHPQDEAWKKVLGKLLPPSDFHLTTQLRNILWCLAWMLIQREQCVLQRSRAATEGFALTIDDLSLTTLNSRLFYRSKLCIIHNSPMVNSQRPRPPEANAAALQPPDAPRNPRRTQRLRIQPLQPARQVALLLLLLAAVPRHVTGAASSVQTWHSSRESLFDYEAVRSLFVESEIKCSAAASGDSTVQLVAFNASSGLCAHFRCRLGLSHCRKCRNANKGAQRVWWLLHHRAAQGVRSVDFYRNWTQYQSEFGEGPDGNYWIGLNTLHDLTASGPRKLRILMKAWNDSEHWAEYSSFSVGPESDNYRLSVSGFSGSAGIGDSLARSNDFQFTTKDADHDVHSDNCGSRYFGAWWFADCHNTHPNGQYRDFSSAIGGPARS
uniref:Fibrinogen C-terminal domain-containing protein n=1 Tax=Macrostomum lignano TaxID=282301 RepID=A0A1I8HUM7_9PLAT